MIEVRVDFNARGANGLVKASLRRADGEIHEGDKVLAVDHDENLSYVAVVDSIDTVSGRVWLEVHWTAARPEPAVPGGFLVRPWSLSYSTTASIRSHTTVRPKQDSRDETPDHAVA